MIIRITILLLSIFLGLKSFAQEKLILRANYDDKKVIAYYHTKSVSPENDVFYYWTSKREIHHSKGDYSGMLLNGAYEEFFLSNQLKKKGQFTDGVKDGEWKQWYESGQLQSIYNWSDGKKSGKYFLYSEEGKLLKRGSYSDDLLHGKQYDLSSDSVVVTKFSKGKERIPKVKEKKEKKFRFKFRKKDINKVETESSKEDKKFSIKELFKKKEGKEKTISTKNKKKSKKNKKSKSAASNTSKKGFFSKVKDWFKKPDGDKKKSKG